MTLNKQSLIAALKAAIEIGEDNSTHPPVEYKYIDAGKALSLANQFDENEITIPTGQDEPCYYCGEPCNHLAGNPGKWPVILSQSGFPKYHHAACVQKRLSLNFLDDESVVEEVAIEIKSELSKCCGCIPQREYVDAAKAAIATIKRLAQSKTAMKASEPQWPLDVKSIKDITCPVKQMTREELLEIYPDKATTEDVYNSYPTPEEWLEAWSNLSPQQQEGLSKLNERIRERNKEYFSKPQPTGGSDA